MPSSEVQQRFQIARFFYSIIVVLVILLCFQNGNAWLSPKVLITGNKCIQRSFKQKSAPSPLIPTRSILCWKSKHKDRSLVFSLSSHPRWKAGDTVHISNSSNTGVIVDYRGAGWYAVQVREDDKKGSSSSKKKVQKYRGTQLRQRTAYVSDKNNGHPNLSSLQGFAASSSSTHDQDFSESLDDKVRLPTIVDLDTTLKSIRGGDPASLTPNTHNDGAYFEQVANHAKTTKWVVFTDLHCAPSTLDTCLQVLDRVHAAAVARDAGILFLGDWWHHRGTIRVDCLNAVLSHLQNWTVPCIMIPGNHDQVTLGGHIHGLTPLENAYRVMATTNENTESTEVNSLIPASLPGPLIFTYPTMFANALFIPHIRSSAIMASVLKSREAATADAIFCHADVAGASMNDLIASKTGISPDIFPPHKHIYAGHFHKPHMVKNGNVSIEYLGSPYQVSLSEAKQQKSLAVVDSQQNWQCVERIPLNIGRKHFKVTSLEEFLEHMPACPPQCNDGSLSQDSVHSNTVHIPQKAKKTNCDGTLVDAGDRVVLTLSKTQLYELRQCSEEGTGSNQLDAHLTRLRAAGVQVEVREVKPVTPLQLGTNSIGVDEQQEQMSLETTWRMFLIDQERRRTMSSAMADQLLPAGLAVLEELALNSTDFNTDLSVSQRNVSELDIWSVTIEGFGPFCKEVTYPLRNRGLVLLRGINQDGGSDSNGSGKSSLAMAALWALTGSVDPRPLQDSKVSDVVNDSYKTARVSLTGALNGAEFTICRTKTKSKSSLALVLDNTDFTAQSVKETQNLIDEKLGVNPQVLARTMFHGQHGLNDLLHTTDAKFKEELSLVVPLSAWQEASFVSRKRAKTTSTKTAELEGMLAVRTEDLGKLRQNLKNVEGELEMKKKSFEELQTLTEREITRAFGDDLSDSKPSVDNLEKLEETINQANLSVKEVEVDYDTMLRQRDSEIGVLERNVADRTAALTAVATRSISLEREHDALSIKVTLAEERINKLEETWGIDLSAGMPELGNFSLPRNCPTCQQPIFAESSEDPHHVLLNKVKQDVSTSFDLLSESQSNLLTVVNNLTAVHQSRDIEEEYLEKALSEKRDREAYWKIEAAKLNERLALARNDREHASKQMAAAAKQVQRSVLVDQMISSINVEKEALLRCEDAVQEARNETTEFEHLVEKLRSERDRYSSTSKLMTELAGAFGQRGVQTFILQNAVELLQSTTQFYLDELSDGSQRLELTLDSGDRISRRALIREGGEGNYKERPLASLSGGQLRRCSLAVNFGFAEMVAMRGNFRPSLCVLDEPLTHLDRSGRSDVGRVLRLLLSQDAERGPRLNVSTILMILQDLIAEELEEAFDFIDEVVKKNGQSSVRVDGTVG